MELMLGHVPAPRPQPRTKGALLTSAMPGTAEGVDWRKGLIHWPESSPYWRVVQDCTADDVAAEYGDETEFSPVATRPFVIQTVTHCPRGPISVMRDRAERNLRAITSTALAHELWTGEASALDPWSLPTGQVTLANPRPDLGTADEGPYVNPYLTGAGSALATGATTIEEAIGLVEAEVEDRIAGGPVYLHIPSVHLMSLLTLRDEGDLIRTPLGSIVVADAGYPPELSDDSEEMTVYGTGPVQYWLDEPVVYDKDSWVVDHETNRVAVWAERAAMLMFDPQSLVGCTVSAT
jgi:hypothetical protein